MREIRWRPRAHLDRESIAIYLGIECSAPQSALAAIKKIDAALERICAFPDIGGFMRSPGPQGREYRTVLAGSYVIFYRYSESELTVYRILHQRKDMNTYTLIEWDET